LEDPATRDWDQGDCGKDEVHSAKRQTIAYNSAVWQGPRARLWRFFRTLRQQVNGQRSARPNAINRDIHDAKRHTAVSLLKDAGIPEAAVMELVGHDSKQMSAHYTHVGREALEKAAAAFPEL